MTLSASGVLRAVRVSLVASVRRGAYPPHLRPKATYVRAEPRPAQAGRMRQPEADRHGQAGHTASVLAGVLSVGGQGLDLGDGEVDGAGGGEPWQGAVGAVAAGVGHAVGH